jgi:polyisoprenoid-binding protein YceI
MSWNIDNAHTLVQFAVRHMMLSKVRGQFEKFSGSVDLDEANPGATKVNVQIETGSVNTREPQRDAHLRSADFFDAEKYPVMKFVSTRVEVTGDATAKMYGDLTIKDLTREVVMNVEFSGKAKSPWGTTSVGFTGTTKINRKDWNLTWNQVLETGGVLVGDEIEITIELELVQA